MRWGLHSTNLKQVLSNRVEWTKLMLRTNHDTHRRINWRKQIRTTSWSVGWQSQGTQQRDIWLREDLSPESPGTVWSQNEYCWWYGINIQCTVWAINSKQEWNKYSEGNLHMGHQIKYGIAWVLVSAYPRVWTWDQQLWRATLKKDDWQTFPPVRPGGTPNYGFGT